MIDPTLKSVEPEEANELLEGIGLTDQRHREEK